MFVCQLLTSALSLRDVERFERMVNALERLLGIFIEAMTFRCDSVDEDGQTLDERELLWSHVVTFEICLFVDFQEFVMKVVGEHYVTHVVVFDDFTEVRSHRKGEDLVHALVEGLDGADQKSCCFDLRL